MSPQRTLKTLESLYAKNVMPALKTFGERIADALVEDGLLPQTGGRLLEQQKREGTRLLKIILEKGYVSEQDMAVSMGRVLNTPPVNPARVHIPKRLPTCCPATSANAQSRPGLAVRKQAVLGHGRPPERAGH